MSPALLLACPACAAREPAGTATLLLLAALIAAPFLVAAVVYRIIRRHVA